MKSKFVFPLIGLVLCFGMLASPATAYLSSSYCSGQRDCHEPTFVGTGLKSSVLFILDNSGSMGNAAYEDGDRTSWYSGSAVDGPVAFISTSNSCASQTCSGYGTKTKCESSSAAPMCKNSASVPMMDMNGNAVTVTCTYEYRCAWSSSSVCTGRYLKTKSCTSSASSSSLSYSCNSDGTGCNVYFVGPSSGVGFSTYIATKKYYGLFDPDYTYQYDQSKHYFKAVGTVVDPNTTDTTTLRGACTSSACDRFSGNWLNWMLATREDVAKKVLTGGRLGGDIDEYVLVGTPADGNGEDYKLYYDNGTNGVYYTPFAGKRFVIKINVTGDRQQRTGTTMTQINGPDYDTDTSSKVRLELKGGKYVPLFNFWKVTGVSSGKYVVADPIVSLSYEDTRSGVRGEPRTVSGNVVRSEDGYYYYAVYHSKTSDETPPTGVIQNMEAKIRMGYMQYNYGSGPAESTFKLDAYGNKVCNSCIYFGNTVTWDFDQDGVTDDYRFYSDGGRVIFPVGEPLKRDSWHTKTVTVDGVTTTETIQMNPIVMVVNETFPRGSTPLGETLREAMNYFRQGDQTNPGSCYGWIDYTLNSAGTAIATKTVMPDFQTNNTWDPFMFNGTLQPCVNSYVVLLSDGEPNQDTLQKCGCNTLGDPNCAHDGSTESAWSIAKTFRFNTATFSDGTTPMLQDDIAYKMRAEDNRPSLGDDTNSPPQNQYVSLYMIQAFGSGSGVMQRMALAGGFIELNGEDPPNPGANYKTTITSNSTYSWSSTYSLSGYQGYYEWDADKSTSPDHYFAADDGYLLADAIQSALNQAAARGSAGAVATISQETAEGDVIVRGAFTGAHPTNSSSYIWDGHLEVYRPDASGYYEFQYEANLGQLCKDMTDGHCDGALCCWDAAQKMRASDAPPLNIFTYLNGTQVAFNLANKTTIATAMPSLGITEVEKLINWVLYGTYADSSGTAYYRNRLGSKLGDIVYSTPVVVGPPSLGSYVSTDTDEMKSFRTYRNNNAARPKVVYVGSNDGMLHAYLLAKWDSTNSTWDYNCASADGYPKCGEEIWSYIPSNFLEELPCLASIKYGTQTCAHRAMVDLSTKAWDVKTSNLPSSTTGMVGCTTLTGCKQKCWRTIILGGQREGGDVYFSLDVTDPLNPRVVWEHSVLKNLAGVKTVSGKKEIKFPFRPKDTDVADGSGTDDVYSLVRTLPMTFSEPAIGRVKLADDVDFYGGWKLSSTLSKFSSIYPDESCSGNNIRNLVFVGGGFLVYKPLSALVATQFPTDTDEEELRKYLTRQDLMAIDFDTGENLFQIIWPLIVEARVDEGKMPDKNQPPTSTTTFIPWAMSAPAILDVWHNSNGALGQDGFIDRLYVGDLRGFMYKVGFNFTKANSTKGLISVDFWKTKAIPPSIPASDQEDPTKCDILNYYRGCLQPITVAPAVSYDSTNLTSTSATLRLLFGSGKFDQVHGGYDDKTDAARMSFYNIKDKVNSYCVTSGTTTNCYGIPLAEPAPTYTLSTSDNVSWTPSTTDMSSGFIISGTNVGISYGNGFCGSVTATRTYNDYNWGCSETTTTVPCVTDQCVCNGSGQCDVASGRTKCANWVTSSGSADCNEPTCYTDSLTNKVCDSQTSSDCACFDCIYDFSTNGERVVGKAVISGGLAIFTTYAPSQSSCGALGNSWLYVLDYRCKEFEDNFTPVTDSFGYSVINLMKNSADGTGLYGVKVNLGSGMGSRPVLDSSGNNVFVQKSDASLVRIGVNPINKQVQFQGWREK